MKKGWVIFGTIMQLLLALLTFFMTIFSGGGFINRGGVSDFDIKVLELAILVLPCLCLISILIVYNKYSNGASARAYAWHGLPLLGWAIYWVYANTL